MSRERLLIIGGGQSGLAAARAGRDRGWEPVVLEAGPEAVGSWPRYYDSLRLFSPVEFSGFPGYAFPGPVARYPTRDDVVGYLRGYADWLGVEVRTGCRVQAVSADDTGVRAELADGSVVHGVAAVAATGSFDNPYVPALPGAERFGGRVLHVAGYRAPDDFVDRRVVVVGAGNSAVQVGYELAQVSRVTLAVRDRVRLVSQTLAGRDLHFWLGALQLDRLPPAVLARVVRGVPVFDAGNYGDALRDGSPDQQPMFTEFTEDGVVWPDGASEAVDAVIFATGYRPHLPYLEPLGALDRTSAPMQRNGLSTARSDLGFLGLEFRRSLSSNTLRGVHRDAEYVVGRSRDRKGP